MHSTGGRIRYIKRICIEMRVGYREVLILKESQDMKIIIQYYLDGYSDISGKSNDKY